MEILNSLFFNDFFFQLCLWGEISSSSFVSPVNNLSGTGWKVSMELAHSWYQELFPSTDALDYRHDACSGHVLGIGPLLSKDQSSDILGSPKMFLLTILFLINSHAMFSGHCGTEVGMCLLCSLLALDHIAFLVKIELTNVERSEFRTWSLMGSLKY